MSNLSQFFTSGGVKSVQRGTISVTCSGGVGSAAATIAAVDATKSAIFWLGQTGTNPSTTSRVTLTNGTTVTANVISGAVSDTVVVGYQVLEFN